MSTKPSPIVRKSVDSIYSLFHNLRNFSNGSERPLRNALFNMLLVAGIGSIIAVGIVLGPFLKPLLWAFLFGAAIYPFKRQLSFGLNSWFEGLEKNDTHLAVGIVMSPLKLLVNVGEYCANWFRDNAKLVLVSFCALLLIGILNSFKAYGLFCLLWRSVIWTHGCFTRVISLISFPILVVIIALYVGFIAVLWSHNNSYKFILAGQVLWLTIAAYICSYLGALQVPIFGSVLLYALIGIGYDLKNRCKFGQSETISQSVAQLLDTKSFYAIEQNDRIVNVSSSVSSSSGTLAGTSSTGSLENIPKTKEQLNIKELQSPSHRYRCTANDHFSDEDEVDSNTYFLILFSACTVTIFYNHTWLFLFLSIPMIIYFIHKFYKSSGLHSIILEKTNEVWTVLTNWIIERHSAILPICLPGMLQLNAKVHIATRCYLKSSIDVVSSTLMIILLILIILFASVFFCVQIYSETFAVVQLGCDLVNRTLTARPDLVQMLPEGFQGSIDNVVDNAHQYGRQYIETYVDDMFKDTEKMQAKKLKDQILLVWDRVIQSWLDRSEADTIGPKIPSSAISQTFDEIIDSPVARQGITDWARANVGMIMDVMDSLWIIFRKNMYLLASLLETVFSMVLGGGYAVIALIVNTIIFFTALFYLLSSSEERYAGFVAIDTLGLSMGTKLTESLEVSISCVIMATAKLALFHGLFTWLTHTWFGAHVVFLPAAIAAMLAAAPFLGTYWCSVPAFLDLWLSQDRFYMGILLFLIHFIIPSSFVDSAIIAEIKGGGHPYLTGLSIAGGMFWLGPEGAILGPLFLCFLVVIFDLTTSSLKESPSYSARTPIYNEKENRPSDSKI